MGPEIKRVFGAEIKITTIKVGSYDDLIEKMNLWASTGMADWPNIYWNGSDNQTKDLYNRLGREGKLIDWMPYLDAMPEVKEKLRVLFPGVITEDGKLYGLPAQYSDKAVILSSGGVYLRADWIKELELAWPKTIQELESVLREFKAKIPPVDGKEIIPIMLFGETFKNLQFYFYPKDMRSIYDSSEWFWDESKKEAYNIDIEKPEYLINALKWHNMLYKDGLIAADCFTMKQGQVDEIMSQGRGGGAFGVDWEMGPYVEGMAAVKDGAMLALTPPLYDASMNSAPATSVTAATPYTLWSMKTDCPEDLVYSFLKYVKWSASEEGTRIINYGVENVHWTMDENGKIHDTPECAERLKGDWSLRVHEGIEWYGVHFDYEAWARMRSDLDLESPTLQPFMKESYKNQGFMKVQGYTKNPNYYITAGPVEMKNSVGASDRGKELWVKCVTGDAGKIEEYVEEWRQTEIALGYEDTKAERTAACSKLDMSFLD